MVRLQKAASAPTRATRIVAVVLHSGHFVTFTAERDRIAAHVKVWDSLKSHKPANRQAIAKRFALAVTTWWGLPVVSSDQPEECEQQGRGSNDCALFALSRAISFGLGRVAAFDRAVLQAMASEHDADLLVRLQPSATHTS